jgi:hypothetical protein
MFVRRLDLIPLPQADQPEGQQAAQLCAPFGRRHVVGCERIGALHTGKSKLACPASTHAPAGMSQREYI